MKRPQRIAAGSNQVNLGLSDDQLSILTNFTRIKGLRTIQDGLRYMVNGAKDFVAKSMATKISSAAAPPAIAAAKKQIDSEPAMDTVDTEESTSDNDMRPPIVSIRGPAITRVLDENEDISRKTPVARYEPDQDRYGSIRND